MRLSACSIAPGDAVRGGGAGPGRRRVQQRGALMIRIDLAAVVDAAGQPGVEDHDAGVVSGAGQTAHRELAPGRGHGGALRDLVPAEGMAAERVSAEGVPAKGMAAERVSAERIGAEDAIDEVVGQRGVRRAWASLAVREERVVGLRIQPLGAQHGDDVERILHPGQERPGTGPAVGPLDRHVGRDFGEGARARLGVPDPHHQTVRHVREAPGRRERHAVGPARPPRPAVALRGARPTARLAHGGTSPTSVAIDSTSASTDAARSAAANSSRRPPSAVAAS